MVTEDVSEEADAETQHAQRRDESSHASISGRIPEQAAFLDMGVDDRLLVRKQTVCARNVGSCSAQHSLTDQGSPIACCCYAGPLA